jgi:polyisoprenoid-binding protein YceI
MRSTQQQINKQTKSIDMTTTQWALDPTHSEIEFKVKHLMISKVTGQFKNFGATVETEGDDFTTAKIGFNADVNSISTNNEQRDAHLKNGDFFDVENHPQLTFVGDKLEQIDEERYKLHGTLTMRGVSKPVVLNVEHGGITQDPWGNTRTGFSITGKVNRMDYGVSFGAVTETGGLLLGDEVTISANTEFVKQAAAIAA